jgi:DNA-binding NarL/FixJ family response regulator
MNSLLTTQGIIVNYRPENVGPIADLELSRVSKDIQKAISDITGYRYVECRSIAELKSLLETDTVEVIECHASLPETCGVTISEFIGELKQLASGRAKLPKFSIIIRHWTPAKTVNAFREAGADGISLHGSSWSALERCGSLNQILIKGSNWPEHIIATLPQDDTRQLQIYFGSNYDQQFDLGITSYSTKFCNNWRDLTGLLTERPSHIVFHIRMTNKLGVSIYEFMSMIETLIKFVIPDSEVAISVAVDRDTHVDTIKEIRKTSAVGIIPSVTGFGKEETAKGIDAIMLHETYWPKHIIATLPGSVLPKAKLVADNNSINLTSRQQEIFNLVARRGLSNKKIAQILSISESTVKVHISAILKSYKVRNRTQLALAGSILGLRA